MNVRQPGVRPFPRRMSIRGYAVLLCLLMIGAALFLVGADQRRIGREYASSGEVVATGTGKVGHCHQVGPLGWEGIGRHWTCDVTVNWKPGPAGPEGSSTVAVRWGQLDPDRFDETVAIEKRQVPQGRSRRVEFDYVVVPAQTDRTRVVVGYLIAAAGVLAMLPALLLALLRMVWAIRSVVRNPR